MKNRHIFIVMIYMTLIVGSYESVISIFQIFSIILTLLICGEKLDKSPKTSSMNKYFG